MTNTLAEHARLFSSLDSLEGVPDWFEPRQPVAERTAWQRTGYNLLAWFGEVLPGIGLAALLAYAGKLLADWIGIGVLRFDATRGSPISPIMLAIVLGLVIRNTIGIPTNYEHGLRLSIKTILRVGIVLLGLKLTLQAIVGIGLVALPVIATCIGIALLAVTFINRALGLPKRLGTLIGVGTSICGISAIVATAPVIQAEEDETSYAVATITLFGLAALFVYPFVAHLLFAGSATEAGLFLGSAIHDTSQVAGAGLMFQQQYGSDEALRVAMAVKLMRNVCMVALIPLMALAYHRSAAGTGSVKRQSWGQLVPLFVIGFAVMACLRTLGDATLGDAGDSRAFGILERGAWNGFVRGADIAAVWCLTIAMAAVGLGTGLAKLRGLGWKPFSVGFCAAVLVGAVSALLIKLLVNLRQNL
ncbi:MAG TPA: putative sulfate exporter family transporter [Tepidisphaeraceae bacterium]|nr:putative sulfate exporter family transporter [Tepidisphaeraceae bacterium]